ncbi:MAG: Periplasmic aromatic amino acid aminotransferase beta precursor, partial [uncultured Rubellimicrobium sp.]
ARGARGPRPGEARAAAQRRGAHVHAEVVRVGGLHGRAVGRQLPDGRHQARPQAVRRRVPQAGRAGRPALPAAQDAAARLGGHDGRDARRDRRLPPRAGDARTHGRRRL